MLDWVKSLFDFSPNAQYRRDAAQYSAYAVKVNEALDADYEIKYRNWKENVPMYNSHPELQMPDPPKPPKHLPTDSQVWYEWFVAGKPISGMTALAQIDPGYFNGNNVAEWRKLLDDTELQGRI